MARYVDAVLGLMHYMQIEQCLIHLRSMIS